jgi:hypothetical protein
MPPEHSNSMVAESFIARVSRAEQKAMLFCLPEKVRQAWLIALSKERRRFEETAKVVRGTRTRRMSIGNTVRSKVSRK